MNIYVGCNKTSHCLKYLGVSLADFNGFLVFEDYPLSCKYNLHTGPFLFAALKMQSPATRIYPEFYPLMLQGCPDGAVACAWPPFGRTDFPLELLRKRFFEYAYAVVWFDNGTFNYWRDYGFHFRAFSKELFEQFLETWKFINKTRPLKPLRGPAYLYDDLVCDNHAAFYEYSHSEGHWGNVINTAEETIPYIWNRARLDGQQTGFICALNSLYELSADDTALLVLPPLCGVSDKQLEAIRKLHAQGVNLLGFENVDGLEDLFGVELLQDPVPVTDIKVNHLLNENPLSEFGNLQEHSEHPLCKGRYRSTGAEELLTGEVPVLLLNQTTTGKAALFNLPPTIVKRDSFQGRVRYGRESISELINKSAAMIHRELCNSVVTTSAGKIITFFSENDKIQVLVSEDAFPHEPQEIYPILTIKLANLKTNNIICNKPVNIKTYPEKTTIRLHLRKNETAMISINNLELNYNSTHG